MNLRNIRLPPAERPNRYAMADSLELKGVALEGVDFTGASLDDLWLEDAVVRDYMTPDPVTLEPEDSLMRVLELMRLRGVRHVPVVLAGELVGLVAEGDVKRAEPSTLSDTQV